MSFCLFAAIELSEVTVSQWNDTVISRWLQSEKIFIVVHSYGEHVEWKCLRGMHLWACECILIYVYKHLWKKIIYTSNVLLLHLLFILLLWNCTPIYRSKISLCVPFYILYKSGIIELSKINYEIWTDASGQI